MTTTHIDQPGARVSNRPAAITAGASLALMAVVAPIAVFILLPAGQTAGAGVLLLLVAVLDVIAAYALSAALDPHDSVLARVTAGLRLAYAAAFAVAASRLLTAGDAVGFEQIWDASLFLFAAHLLAVAVLGWRSGILPKWICVLVLLAGLGYLIDTMRPMTGLGFEVSTVAFVGEVALLLWLLIRGGRASIGRCAPVVE